MDELEEMYRYLNYLERQLSRLDRRNSPLEEAQEMSAKNTRSTSQIIR